MWVSEGMRGIRGFPDTQMSAHRGFREALIHGPVCRGPGPQVTFLPDGVITCQASSPFPGLSVLTWRFRSSVSSCRFTSHLFSVMVLMFML